MAQDTLQNLILLLIAVMIFASIIVAKPAALVNQLNDLQEKIFPWKEYGGETVLSTSSSTFAENVVIKYDLPSKTNVKFTIINSSKIIVGYKDFGEQKKGSYEYSWDGKNNGGQELIDGSYTINLTTKDGSFLIDVNKRTFVLLEITPNPFTTWTDVKFILYKEAEPIVHIYDDKKTLVESWTLKNRDVGRELYVRFGEVWAYKNPVEAVQPGTYFIQLTTPAYKSPQVPVIKSS